MTLREHVLRVIRLATSGELAHLDDRQAWRNRAEEHADAILALLPALPPGWVEHMVQRFLGWSIPETFRPDNGVSFTRLEYNGKPYPMPNGTNLLDAREAKAMVLHMIEGLPTPTVESAVGERVYERISELMGAEAGTPEGNELACLAALVADVEEYGFGLSARPALSTESE